MRVLYNDDMNLIHAIVKKVKQRQYEFSKHALGQTIVRNISVPEIEAAILNGGEVVENYADDKYGPSCLLLGFTNTGRPIHIQCSYPDRHLIKIITVYEPDPTRWTNYKMRK